MDRWWEQDADALVLGVFQGGGAKGVAYGGALKAVAAHGMWFSQVAGSSAGAITAAMVAAGVRPGELDTLTADAMKRVKRQTVWLILGRESLLNSRKLGDWLDAQLRKRVRGTTDGSGPGVTFADLERASGIGCHVVALDLATGHPIVFSGALTPDAQVVEAVLASSAIPGALDAGRAAVAGGTPSDPVRVHQLIDGGAWANFPTFVFRDPAFRSWAHRRVEESGAVEPEEAVRNLEDETTDAPLLGFVLDSPPSNPIEVAELRSRRWRYYPEADLGTARSARSLPSFVVSMLLGPKEARLVLAVTVVTLIAIAASLLPELLVDINEWALRHFDWWGGALIGGGASLVVLLTALVVGALLLLTLLFGRAIAYSGLPSARALLGVATRVPPWAHDLPKAVVLNLRSLGLSTLSFRAKDDDRARVVAMAEAEATSQLRVAKDDLVGWGIGEQRFTTPPPARPAEPVARRRSDVDAWLDRRAPFVRVALMAVLLILLGWGVSFVIFAVLTDYILGWAFFGLCMLVYVVWTLRMLSQRAQRRAAGESPFETRAMVQLAVWVAVLVGASVLSARVAGDRDLAEATVQSAARANDSDETTYIWSARDGGRRGELTTDLSFRVGEEILIERPPDGVTSADLATPGDNPFALLLFPLGFGLAAVVTIYILADEWHYRRFRRALTARPGGVPR